MQVLHMLPHGAQAVRASEEMVLPDPVRRLSVNEENAEFLGHVLEGSTIAELRFRKLPHVIIERGDLVMVWTQETSLADQGAGSGSFV